MGFFFSQRDLDLHKVEEQCRRGKKGRSWGPFELRVVFLFSEIWRPWLSHTVRLAFEIVGRMGKTRPRADMIPSESRIGCVFVIIVLGRVPFVFGCHCSVIGPGYQKFSIKANNPTGSPPRLPIHPRS